MSGEVSMTAAVSGTLQVPLQGIEIDLHYVNLSSRESIDEVCSCYTRDLGPPALGDQAAPVPIDCCRETNVLR